jgi:hypothetical protein
MITLLADSSSQGHTDVAARVLGIVAIVIASGSLFLAYRTYRRGGARVKIKATKKVHDVVLYANGPIYGDVVEVVASNHGLASAQVAMMFFDVKGKKGFIEVQPSGPSLPHLRGSRRHRRQSRRSSMVQMSRITGSPECGPACASATAATRTAAGSRSAERTSQSDREVSRWVSPAPLCPNHKQSGPGKPGPQGCPRGDLNFRHGRLARSRRVQKSPCRQGLSRPAGDSRPIL